MSKLLSLLTGLASPLLLAAKRPAAKKGAKKAVKKVAKKAAKKTTRRPARKSGGGDMMPAPEAMPASDKSMSDNQM